MTQAVCRMETLVMGQSRDPLAPLTWTALDSQRTGITPAPLVLQAQVKYDYEVLMRNLDFKSILS